MHKVKKTGILSLRISGVLILLALRESLAYFLTVTSPYAKKLLLTIGYTVSKSLPAMASYWEAIIDRYDEVLFYFEACSALLHGRIYDTHNVLFSKP